MASKRRVMSKSEVAKRSARGEDLGKPGKGFAAGVRSIEARGGSEESAKRIMGAQLQKQRRAGKL